MSIKPGAENITHDKSNNLSEAQMLQQLQEILLKKDRQSLDNLHETLNSKELLSEKISPIIEEHLDFLVKNFPKEFHDKINKIVEVKIHESQEDIINLISPKLGKMIQKYIENQFQLLKERT